MSLILNMVSGLFHFVSALLRRWQLVLIVGVAISPIGPHIRWQYTYTGSYSHKTYMSCDYMGSRGLIIGVPHAPPNCPFILILDTREYAR